VLLLITNKKHSPIQQQQHITLIFSLHTTKIKWEDKKVCMLSEIRVLFSSNNSKSYLLMINCQLPFACNVRPPPFKTNKKNISSFVYILLIRHLQRQLNQSYSVCAAATKANHRQQVTIFETLNVNDTQIENAWEKMYWGEHLDLNESNSQDTGKTA
jgi:hypothetical protein